MPDGLHHRITVYQILSEALKEPTEDFIRDLPVMTAALKEAFHTLGYRIPLISYQDWPILAGTPQELLHRYYGSFFYPNENRVVPVESIYRQWTFDETAQVPFAKEKGYLMSDAALHMKTLYAQMGLTVPAEYDSSPDHLCLECEFAALLLTEKKLDWYGTFVKDHLAWVHELYDDAVNNNIDRFYREVITVTRQFIDCELEIIG